MAAVRKCGFPALLELEKKFAATEGLRPLLHSLAAEPPIVSTFEDSYFDTPDLWLTLQDRWLRLRQGNWELKLPASNTSLRERDGGATLPSNVVGKTGVSGVDAYLELTDPAEIAGTLGIPTGTMHSPDAWTSTLQDGVRSIGLDCFARMQTERTSFALQPRPTFACAVKVDVDIVTFYPPSHCSPSAAIVDELPVVAGEFVAAGPHLSTYMLAEVEVLLEPNADRSAGHQTLAAVLSLLAVSPSTPSRRGKVLEYLHRFRPQHLEALLQRRQANEA